MFEQLPLFDWDVQFDPVTHNILSVSVQIMGWDGQRLEVDHVECYVHEFGRGDFAYWMAIYGA